jgi:hypothetical protein
MAVTVGVNNRTVVHKGSGGKSVAFPDVCLTQVGPAVVPIPYPNIAQSSDMDNGAKTVTADGQPLGHEKSFFSKSVGDEAGSNKGVASGTTAGKSEFVSFSFDVEVEGKGVVRAMDQMLNNNKNTPPTPLLQPPLIQTIIDETPVIPEQGKMEMQFFDPFGEPMEDLELEMEVDGKEEKKVTMSKGQIFYVTKQEKATLSLKNNRIDLKVEE